MPTNPRGGLFFSATALAAVTGQSRAAALLVSCCRHVSFLCLFRVLIAIPAPVELSQKLWDPDVGARDALSSFVIECCLNDAFCFDLWNEHAIVFDDLYDEQRIAVLAHLLNGKCISAPSNPSCKLFARDAPSMIHLSNLLCSSLLVTHQNKSIPLQVFSLCCGSIDLSATTAYPGRESQSKLQQRLKLRVM